MAEGSRFVQGLFERVHQRIGTAFRRHVRNGYHLHNTRELLKNRKRLSEVRAARGDIFSKANPKVSVLIPTYNRRTLLTERALPSVLRQTHANIEVVVVGDHCTDDTAEAMGRIRDARVRFLNLAQRGDYPEVPQDRWMVAGTKPANQAIRLASGDWFTCLDDDDALAEDHVERLLDFAARGRYEMVYGQVAMEKAPARWKTVGAWPLRLGGISHLAVLYHASLRFFQYDIHSWRYGEPADWNMWRRMKQAGVRIGFLDQVVGKHYLEGTTIEEAIRA